MQLTPLDVNSFDISDPEFWVAPREYRESAFASLRREAPIKFFKEMPLANFPVGPGYYALTKHEDIWAVSRNPELWCSGQGSNITTLTPELNEFFGSMIAMDDPKHFRLRSIVSKGFTPKEIARVEEYVTAKARTLVDTLLEQHADEEFDFPKRTPSKFSTGRM